MSICDDVYVFFFFLKGCAREAEAGVRAPVSAATQYSVPLDAIFALRALRPVAGQPKRKAARLHADHADARGEMGPGEGRDVQEEL